MKNTVRIPREISLANKNKTDNLPRKIIASLIIFFNILILLHPTEMIGAASDGLKLWLNVVFPSLFPFMVGVNLLTELGAVEALGQVLGPVTRRLFRLPGVSGFALISGMISGYPMGVKITASLRERGELTKRQAQRLLGFVNNCGPLFVVGAVGAGMFKSAAVGYFILIIHYFSAVFTGVTLSIFADKGCVPEEREPDTRLSPESSGACSATLHARAAVSRASDEFSIASPPSRPFGEILGAGVQDAMFSILKVGGFIIIFSVLVKSAEMLNLSGLARGAASGFLEMTNGIKTIAADSGIGQRIKIAAAAGMVSFGGLSIHAQSAAFLKGSDLRAKWYYVGKSVQTALSASLAAAFYPLLNVSQSASAERAEVFAEILTGGGFAHNLAVSLGCFAVFAAVIWAVSFFAGSVNAVKK